MKLLGCPFCGEANPFWEEQETELHPQYEAKFLNIRTELSVVCQECGAATTLLGKDFKECAGIWNSRAVINNNERSNEDGKSSSEETSTEG